MPDETRIARNKARAKWIALGLVVLGFGATALDWRMALHDGSFNPGAALIMPFLGFVGLGVLVAPGEVLPSQSLGPVSQPFSIRRFLAFGLIGLGLVASAADYALVTGWL